MPTDTGRRWESGLGLCTANLEQAPRFVPACDGALTRLARTSRCFDFETRREMSGLCRAGVGLRIVRASNRFGSSRWVTLWLFLGQVGSKSCSFTRVTLVFVQGSLSCGHGLEVGKVVVAEGFPSKFIFVLVRKAPTWRVVCSRSASCTSPFLSEGRELGERCAH